MDREAVAERLPCAPLSINQVVFISFIIPCYRCSAATRRPDRVPSASAMRCRCTCSGVVFSPRHHSARRAGVTINTALPCCPSPTLTSRPIPSHNAPFPPLRSPALNRPSHRQQHPGRLLAVSLVSRRRRDAASSADTSSTSAAAIVNLCEQGGLIFLPHVSFSIYRIYSCKNRRVYV